MEETSRHQWELIIEIEEDQPKIAWIHSTWERWTDHLKELGQFKALNDRPEYLVGTLPAEAVTIRDDLDGDWEEAMFRAEQDRVPKERVDDSPEVLPEERTTVLRIGGEDPFWLEIESESPLWLELLAAHPRAICISRTPEGTWPRQRWLLPQSLLRLG